MKIIEEIEGLVSSKLAVMKTMMSIIKLETRLAGLSIFPLLLNVCMLLIVLMTLWASTMTLLGYFLIVTFDNPMLAIGSIVLLNLAIILGLSKYLAFNLKQMSFEKTREYILNKENEHGKETINRSDCNEGKNITISPNQSTRT